MNRTSKRLVAAVVALALAGALVLLFTQKPAAPQAAFTTLKGEQIALDSLRVKVVLVTISALLFLLLPQLYLVTLTTQVRPSWVRIAIIAGVSLAIYLIGVQRLYLRWRLRRRVVHATATTSEKINLRP